MGRYRIKVCFSLGLALSGLGLALLPSGIGAAAAVPSFEGKRITGIIGSQPGGSSDSTARTLGPFLAKYLPGNPTIIFQNQPGAGGINALNSFANRAEPDGLAFYVGAGNQVAPVTLRRTDIIKYDPSQLKMFGGFANDSSYILLRKNAAARLTEKSRAPVVIGELDGTRSSTQMPIWGAEALGWNVRWVLGYSGTPAMIYALDQGEIDMITTNTEVDMLVDGGAVDVVAQTGMLVDGKIVPSSSFPQVPLFADKVVGKFGGTALRSYLSWQRHTQIGKWLALPPRTREEIVEAYRRAFAGMLRDRQFQVAFAKTESVDYKPMSVADLETLMREMVATPDETLQYLLALRHKYGM